MELMKQKQYSPMSVAQQAVSLYAVERGYLDDIELDKVGDFEEAMQAYMSSDHASMMTSINDDPKFDDDADASIKAALDTFKSDHTW
jgi:F-type H+-transporting ATPase subunit alpha